MYHRLDESMSEFLTENGFGIKFNDCLKKWIL